MDQVQRMTSLMAALQMLTDPMAPVVSVTEQLSKPMCNLMTHWSQCQQPDICWTHKIVIPDFPPEF